MRRFIGAFFLTAFVFGPGSQARADDSKDAKAILDKAISALGGEEKLAAVKTATWKSKGKISIGGNDSDFTAQSTAQGLDRYRGEFEGDFGGNKVSGVTVVNGDKGWRKFADNNMELDKEGVASEKLRSIYLQVIPITILPLKGNDFKVETAGEEKVGDKPALAVKATGPDGKDFKIFFDKESGLPVKLTAKVVGFMGEEFTQDTSLGGYKDFAGIKKATKIVYNRDGEKFMDIEVTEFKVVDKVDPKTFDKPE